MNKDTGGPAFPRNISYPHESGMTLRDYFAAKAMQAVWLKLDPDAVRSLSVSQTATTAYDMADAMLEERNKT